MTSTVIYLRLSYDKTGEMLGVDRQREDCLEIVKRRGWELVGEYSDNSISASKRNVSRPEYDRMVADYEAGLFEAIVVYDLDRLTRQPRQLEDWIDRATERGLRLVTANGEADLGTDAGRLFARIKAAVSREEIERKGARQKRANLQRIKAGGQASWKPCLGYTSSNKVVPGEAEIVRQLFERFAAGETVYGVTKWLDTQKVKPKQSERWSRTTVRGILTNPRYVGRVVYQGEQTTIQGDWEVIVEAGLFDSVQAILSDPRRKINKGQTARKHLLSGIATCAVCGWTVRGQGYAYTCPHQHLTRAREHVDTIVLGVVTRRLASIGEIELVSKSDPKLDARAVELRGRLATIEADYDAGLIDGLRFSTANEKVKAELNEVERQRRSKVGGAALATVLGSFDPVEAFTDASLGVRRAVIDAMVKVTLLKREKGHKVGWFDPESVQIEWKDL